MAKKCDLRHLIELLHSLIQRGTGSRLMTQQHHHLAFFVAPRRLGALVLFSLALLGPHSVFAAYADCSPGFQQANKVDCFSMPQLMPQLEVLTANGVFAAEVATVSGIAAANTQAAPAAPGFYIAQPHKADGHEFESLPFMLLLTVLLAVLLVRAKKLNNK